MANNPLARIYRVYYNKRKAYEFKKEHSCEVTSDSLVADLYKCFYYLLDDGRLKEADVQYFKMVG